MVREELSPLACLIARHAKVDGINDTPIERLRLMRSHSPTLPIPWAYRPSLCVVAQGAKAALWNGQSYRYDPSCYLVVSVDLPAVSHIAKASVDEPFLSFHLGFDTALVARYVEALPWAPLAAPMATTPTEPELADACFRLLSLLDTPEDIAALTPLIEQEIVYRLVKGGAGATLRHIAGNLGDNAVGRAVQWVKGHFCEPFTVQELASEVGLSESVLFERFKALTALSPIHYRTSLRLHEARRLMVFEGFDAAQAAYRVGYGTPSQFSREYRRFFGHSPAADAGRLRQGHGLNLSV